MEPMSIKHLGSIGCSCPSCSLMQSRMSSFIGNPCPLSIFEVLVVAHLGLIRVLGSGLRDSFKGL